MTTSSTQPQGDLPRRIRLLCQRQGLRPSDLARALDVDKAAVSRWMKEGKGGSRPRLPIETVAGAMKLSVVEFYGADLDKIEADLELERAKAS